jgi:type I restriction enzyme S subunit
MWMLNSPTVKTKASALIKGVGRPRLGLGGIRQLAIPLPPLNEQRRIVAAIEEHLSRLDAADASLAVAERRARGLVSASLGEAVDAHPTVELGEVTTHHRYGTSVKCTAEPVGVPVLRIPNVKHGRINTSDLKFATRSDLGDAFVEAGDLLVVRTNGSRDLIGRTAVVDGAAGMAFASYLIRARPTAGLDPAWAVIALSSPRLRAEIETRAASTAGQYNLNLASLRSLPIPLPALEEQRRIVARVEEQLSAIDALRAAIERAERRSQSLRRAVLERAFRGELVPQDPTDEPAEALLARIRAERGATRSGARRPRTSK